jgi:hypothetical protein
MSLITFVRAAAPAASFEPTHNPKYGSDDARMIRRHQPVNLAQADVYSYNKGQSIPVSLKWANMPTADLTALLAFFSAISGARYTFTYTDWNGTAHTARIVSTNIQSRHVASNFHEVAFELELS